MPHTPEAYLLTPVKYVGEGGSIPALLLYERDGLSYLRLQTKNWPHYDGWGLWSTVGIWSEHVVTADPNEPGVADLLHELQKEAAAHHQHVSNCRHRANGQRASERVISKQENGQHAKAGDEQHVHDQKKVIQGSDVKPPPKSAQSSASQRKAGTSGGDFHPLKPVRSIAGLTLPDFLYNR